MSVTTGKREAHTTLITVERREADCYRGEVRSAKEKEKERGHSSNKQEPRQKEQKMDESLMQSCWLLLTLFLKGILGDWSVHLPDSPICAVIGSSVVLPCSYDYPKGSDDTREGGRFQQDGGGEGQQYKALSEMWCLEDSRCITPRYVFHSAGIFPDPSYQNRVQYLGQTGTKNCSLRISDLKRSDSGTYVFYLITNHPTEKMPEQRGLQLLVADSPTTVTVSASPSSDITEGAALHLSCCSPAASPAAIFRWYKKASTTPRHTGLVWNISEVTPNDSGSYYCQIQTGDIVQDSTMLVIDVQYSPQNTTVSTSPAGELQDGHLVTLTCSSKANPPVHTYSWYQGAACLPTADKSFYQARQSLATATGRGLTVSSTNVTTEGHGQYCCVARNRHGSQTYSVTLSAMTPSDSAGGRVVLIGVTVGVLLAIIAIAVFLMTRKWKSSTHQAYVLTETTATEP
ncbi:V-set and immunoglobulin domain-containing protein 2 [Mastacembelus armatus]|uniref:B-cell receptor CD22 n=1 Tax=Mastacembelus armatus TaxID=205130 RepID=A0A3Q3KT85_9TELE|nr:V-set and immunoglobulin domain-containing protein 2-like [Mastacembelus armatus]